MKHALNDPAIRARYLAVLRETGVHSQASVAVGLESAWTCRYRKRTPEFAAECAAVLAEPGERAPRPFVRWTPRLQERFLAAFAQTGNASAAALACGMELSKVLQRRRHDGGFGAAWSDARNEAAQRLMDKVFDGAMNGFVRTETVGGQVRRVVYQRPDLMERLVTRLETAVGRNRTVELTPDLIERARAAQERRIEFEVARRLAEAAAAAPLHAVPALPTFVPTEGTKDP